MCLFISKHIIKPKIIQISWKVHSGLNTQWASGCELKQILPFLGTAFIFVNEIANQLQPISLTFYARIFCTKVLCAAFLQLHFGLVNFWHKIIDAKRSHTTLMKLTPAINFINVIRVYFSCKLLFSNFGFEQTFEQKMHAKNVDEIQP